MIKWLALFLLLPGVTFASNEIIQHLQDISVTIKSGSSQGSGVLFSRRVADETVTFVWTAGHVVDGLRKQRKVIDKGVEKYVVEFNDAQIIQEFRQKGRRIGEQTMDCRVIRYSSANQGEDLALLEVRKRNFADIGTTFYKGDIPAIGTELFHVGSLRGQFGANSLTTGVVSQIGRVLDLGANGVVFDQTTATAFPGSSGGGVFLKENGNYVGMLVRGAGEQFNFVVPVRRIRAWAKKANIEWAMDRELPMPDISKMPIEDIGVDFNAKSDTKSNEYKFPTLLLTEDGQDSD